MTTTVAVAPTKKTAGEAARQTAVTTKNTTGGDPDELLASAPLPRIEKLSCADLAELREQNDRTPQELCVMTLAPLQIVIQDSMLSDVPT
jgi:hypothetical protein